MAFDAAIRTSIEHLKEIRGQLWDVLQRQTPPALASSSLPNITLKAAQRQKIGAALASLRRLCHDDGAPPQKKQRTAVTQTLTATMVGNAHRSLTPQQCDAYVKTHDLFAEIIQQKALPPQTFNDKIQQTQMALMRSFPACYQAVMAQINQSNPADVLNSNVVNTTYEEMQELRMIRLPALYPQTLQAMHRILQQWRAGSYGSSLRDAVGSLDEKLLPCALKAVLLDSCRDIASLEELRHCELLRPHDASDGTTNQTAAYDRAIEELFRDAEHSASLKQMIAGVRAAEDAEAVPEDGEIEEERPNAFVRETVQRIAKGGAPQQPVDLVLRNLVDNLICRHDSPHCSSLPLLFSWSLGTGNLPRSSDRSGALPPLEVLWQRQNKLDTQMIDAIVVDEDLAFAYTFSDDEDGDVLLPTSTAPSHGQAPAKAPSTEYLAMVIAFLQLFPDRLAARDSAVPLMTSILNKTILKGLENTHMQDILTSLDTLNLDDTLDVLGSLLRYQAGYAVQFAHPQIGSERVRAIITTHLNPYLEALAQDYDDADSVLNDFNDIVKAIAERQHIEAIAAAIDDVEYSSQEL